MNSQDFLFFTLVGLLCFFMFLCVLQTFVHNQVLQKRESLQLRTSNLLDDVLEHAESMGENNKIMAQMCVLYGTALSKINDPLAAKALYEGDKLATKVLKRSACEEEPWRVIIPKDYVKYEQ